MSALGADSLQGGVDQNARTLSELYLVVRDGDRLLEGYIDLLVDAGPESLSMLDYKTTGQPLRPRSQ